MIGRMFWLWKRIFACLISWLGACLQVRLRLPSLRTRAAQHPHTLQTQNTHTRFKHNTAERNRTNDVGAQPPIVSSSFCLCCVVFFIFKYIVWSVCVFCVWSVCEAMEAASAPAGKPPAKRLGKHWASHSSDWGRFSEKKVPYFRGDFMNKKLIILIKIM